MRKATNSTSVLSLQLEIINWGNNRLFSRSPGLILRWSVIAHNSLDLGPSENQTKGHYLASTVTWHTRKLVLHLNTLHYKSTTLPSPSPLGFPIELIITSPLARQWVVWGYPRPVFWATSSGEIICHKAKIIQALVDKVPESRRFCIVDITVTCRTQSTLFTDAFLWRTPWVGP